MVERKLFEDVVRNMLTSQPLSKMQVSRKIKTRAVKRPAKPSGLR
jgi:hypothetical protein